MKRLFIFILLTWATPLSVVAETIALTESQRNALGIETVAVESAGSRISASLPGKVTVPNVQLHVLTAPQGGLVERLLVAEGESVITGQPLIEIESPQWLALQSEYLEVWSRHQLAKTNYERDVRLQREGIIAERRLLESRAEYEASSASLSRVRGMLELAGVDQAGLDALRSKRSLDGTLTVRAPFDGVVLEQMVTAGSRVEAADPLYRIGRLKPLWVEVHVPLDKAGAIQPGERAVVSGIDVSGPVVAIGSMVHGADQGVLVRAEIDDGAERLRPGQFVQVRLASIAGERHFRVPRAALVYRDGAGYVFVARADGFDPVPAKVLSEEPAHVIIEADLAPDTRIAMTGTAAIKAAWLGGD